MTNNRKYPTEKAMLARLRAGRVYLPPLTFRVLGESPGVRGGRRFDALAEAAWRKGRAKFAVECKSLSTPKSFRDGLNRLKTSTFPKHFLPMLFLPFLDEEQLEELEREGISGIDLCGNGVVVAPGVFTVFRSGGKNRFSSSQPIKNIYRKNSSMVGRVFLARPGYDAVRDICSEINRRNILVRNWDKKPMSLSTVSKSLKTLEEDLIVDRKDRIRLLQPDTLLEKLSENYAPPALGERVGIKIPDGAAPVSEMIRRVSQSLEMPLVAAGTSSVGQITVMPRGDILSVYCPRLEEIVDRLPGDRSDRFPNVELIETEDETVYFDSRQAGGFWWASPVQVYLELASGDKRDRETARQVKSYILKGLETEPR